MAADSATSVGDARVVGRQQKVFRLPDGSLVGFAGTTADALAAVHALLDNPYTPENTQGDYTLLRLRPNGKLWCYEGRLDRPFPVTMPHAIGSGMDFALGALLHGADATEAVKIACKLDIYSGGKVLSVQL